MFGTGNLGQVVLQKYPNGQNYVFNDVDGQHFSAALSSAPYASFSYGAAITNSGGSLYATNNDAGGIVYRLNPDGSINSPLTGAGISAVTLVATGGSRGDYVGVDSTNGTLFLTQTDSVYRLDCGPSCFFVPPPPMPEPGTYA